MNFIELNPMMTGRSLFQPYADCHELTFDCPVCHQRTGIYVHFNGGEADAARHVWKLEIPTGQSWDSATISPSISTHHLKRTPDGDIRCQMHITINKGQFG